MLLSIVSGTYNRRMWLEQMVRSARACLPRGVEYEFVVVDGGSSDGTLEWCQQQPDVKLIEQGELLGAIKAFDTGAYAAQGDYVLLANDDIQFMPGSIMPAVAYLETHPLCGAVAFMDNRPAPGYGEGFKVQNISVRNPQGEIVGLPYPQVGMVRKWLGDACWWWGSRNPAMAGAHTYGGDSHLGAQIWRRGYTVDAVEACKIIDLIPPDNLRERNHQIEQQNPGVYYKAFREPPQIPTQPLMGPPHQERLRILYLPIYEPNNPHQYEGKRGLREALARRGLVYEVDYVNEGYNLPELVRNWQPHILFMQAHGASIPLSQLHPAREAKPDMLVINWNGDVHERFLTEPFVLDYLKHIDLQLTVNANVLEIYRQQGIAAAYWQVGFEPVDSDALPPVPQHDVVFLANAYSDERKQLGALLQGMPGVNVGLYGRGWKFGNGDCTYNFPVSTALYQRATIAIGDNQFPKQRGFVSNRLFEALAGGVFLLHQKVLGLEELTGLQDGVHYVEWTDERDLQQKIRHWLQPRMSNQRRQIATVGQAFVHERHSFDCRIEELFQLLERVQA